MESRFVLGDNQFDRELETGKVPKPPITGDARNWLLRGIEDARKKADRWCRLVEGEDEVRAKLSNSYLIEQVSELRSQVQSVCQLVMEALSELSSEANPVEIAASALCAKRSLHQLLSTLGIEFDDVKHISPVVPELVSIIGDTGELNLAMARRLLWTGNVKLDDDGLPIKDSLDAVIQDLANSVQNENTLGQAIEIRMERQDYRFIDSVSRAIPDEIKCSIKTRLQKAIQDSIDTFEDYITLVERRVRQAARDGIIEIDDSKWIDYNSRIEGIRSHEDTLNFSLITEELEDVEIGLQELSESRYTDLCEEWESALSEQPDDNSNVISSWKEKFDTAKDRRDIRVMEECLMRLRTGSIGIPYHDLGSDDGSRDGAENSLANFISFFEEVQDIEGYTHTNTGLRALQSRLSSLG